jgi:hypothetical protein
MVWNRLTDEQKQIIIGTLLGDGDFRMDYASKGKMVCYRFGQEESKQEYVKFVCKS